MKIFKYIFIILLFFLLTFSVNAFNLIDSKTEKAYNSFIKKVEKKYIKEAEITFLESLSDKLEYILSNRKLTKKQEKLVNDLIKLNNEKIFILNIALNNTQNSQIFKEYNIKTKLKKELYYNRNDLPFYINKLIDNNKIFYFISEKAEFIIDNRIKKIDYKQYYKLTSSNYKEFIKRDWIIIKIKWQSIYRFVENYSIKDKIPYSWASKYFKNYITEKTNFYESNEVYYSYNFSSYKYISDDYGFYKDELEEIIWDLDSILVFVDENKRYNFIIDYKIVRLIKSYIIYWVANKINFLKHVISDKKNLNTNTDNEFIKLKDYIKDITYKKSKNTKIELIYDYILENISYTKNINLSDYKIFSWIDTFKNNSWVCNWYTKLFSYMLMFSWISNSEMIKWYVIDAKDFPEIWHSWIRIWDRYYDVTFDDPIWLLETRKKSNYKYFALPKDLFYTNRYTYESIPESLKTTSLEYRENLIKKRLLHLVSKYKNYNYKLLSIFKFKDKYNIDYDKDITINKLKQIMTYYRVENWSFELSWVKRFVKKVNYYNITDDNIETILEQFDYNIKNLYLLKWYITDSQFEYRLAFNLEY